MRNKTRELLIEYSKKGVNDLLGTGWETRLPVLWLEELILANGEDELYLGRYLLPNADQILFLWALESLKALDFDKVYNWRNIPAGTSPTEREVRERLGRLGGEFVGVPKGSNLLCIQTSEEQRKAFPLLPFRWCAPYS